VGVPGDVETSIGEFIADLIPDGATIQLGIGGIPAATARALVDKHDLGVITIFADEITSDSGWVTATIRDEDLATLVAMAHERGLKMYVCPMLAPENWGPGVKGKGNLEPSDPDAFFEDYTAFIDHYAELAERTCIDMLWWAAGDTLTRKIAKVEHRQDMRWRTARQRGALLGSADL
jgi:hypothetical protein